MRKKNVIKSFLLLFLSGCLLTSCNQNQQGKEDQKPISNENKSPSVNQSASYYAGDVMGCKNNSWSPETYTLYGDPATIIAKLKNFNIDLPSRRTYIIVIEGKETAEVDFFEKDNDTEVNVKTWKGSEALSLNTEIAHHIMANKGVACIGEQTKAIITKLSPKDLGNIPTPVNIQAAFSHLIKSYTDDFIRVSIYVMC